MSESGGADPEFLDELRREMGLDEPAPRQYFKWLGVILAGDWGTA